LGTTIAIMSMRVISIVSSDSWKDGHVSRSNRFVVDLDDGPGVTPSKVSAKGNEFG